MAQESSCMIHSFQNTKGNRLRRKKVNYRLKIQANSAKSCTYENLGVFVDQSI